MEKLEAYRLRKRRKERFEIFKSKVVKMIPFYNEKRDDDVGAVVVDHVEPSSSKTRASPPPSIIQPSNSQLSSTLTISVSPGYSESEIEFASDNETINTKTSKQVEDANPVIDNTKQFLFWLVIFIFWVTCYAIAIELQFGIVFLILTLLCGIYYNTRTGPKKPGEVSAYSVFNKDCHAIDGTLNAEQFEREIRYGPASVR